MSSLENLLHKDIKIRKVKSKDLAIFFRQLAIMFDAQVSITEIFETLSKEKNNLSYIIRDINKKIQGGEKLSDALSYYPKVFNKYYISIVRAGELSGNLTRSLNFLADELEKNQDTFGKIKSALAYPIFTIITMIIVVIVITLYVIPKMSDVLLESGAQLPVITRVLIAISTFFIKNAIIIVLIISGIIFALTRWYKTKDGELFFHKLILKLPVFGKIFEKIYVTRITKNLYVLIRSEIKLVDALEITSDIVGNRVYEDTMLKIASDVRNGERTSVAFSKSNKFSDLLINMISTGEKTGKLDYTLEKITDYYVKELNNATGTITSLIEPIVIVFLGIIVVFIILSVLLPMYSLSSQI